MISGLGTFSDAASVRALAPVWESKFYGAFRGRGRALPGPRHGCNGRGGALRGAGARREGPRPAAGRAGAALGKWSPPAARRWC